MVCISERKISRMQTKVSWNEHLILTYNVLTNVEKLKQSEVIFSVPIQIIHGFYPRTEISASHRHKYLRGEKKQENTIHPTGLRFLTTMMAILPPTSPTTVIGGFSLAINTKKKIHSFGNLSFISLLDAHLAFIHCE